MRVNCLCKRYQATEWRALICAAEITCVTKLWNSCEIVVGDFEGTRPIGRSVWLFMINWVSDTFLWVCLVTSDLWQYTPKILLLVTTCLYYVLWFECFFSHLRYLEPVDFRYNLVPALCQPQFSEGVFIISMIILEQIVKRQNVNRISKSRERVRWRARAKNVIQKRRGFFSLRWLLLLK
jgi:hypothetical protein